MKTEFETMKLPWTENATPANIEYLKKSQGRI